MSAVGKIDSSFLRPLQTSDLDAVMAIERAAYRYPWTPGIFRDCLDTGYNCWALLTGQGLSGYSVMSVMAGESHLLNICIDPQLQHCGLGRLLLEHMIGVAAEHHASLLLLEVRPSNAAAIALYEKMGFGEIGLRKDYYPADKGREDGLILALNIN